MSENEKRHFICFIGDWHSDGSVYGFGHSEDEALEDAYRTLSELPLDEEDPAAREELTVDEIDESAWQSLRASCRPVEV